MTARTFGLSRIGRTQVEFVTQAADLLCRETALRWLGEAGCDAAVPLCAADDLCAHQRADGSADANGFPGAGAP